MARILLILLLAVGISIGVYALTRPSGPGLVAATYVDRAACIECHKEQHETWQGSHHDLAMDHATPESVRGDFNDAAFTHHGVTSRFFRRGEAYFVNTEGPDGALRDYEILYTFGWEPLQQYLIDVGNGRLQCLQVSWDTEAKRWFHIQEDRVTPTDPLHWTGLQFNANFMCIECHVTGYERNYKPETNGYASSWHDIDVGCQACHGPGSNHVAWARGSRGDDPSKGLNLRFKAAPSSLQVDSCARCHARRVLLTDSHAQGEPLLDHMAARLLVEPLYHADGQIDDEVYVYGSFLQSPMHQKGVRCTDCHDPHSARLLHEGDAVCTSCHQENPPERFPTLRKARYDTAAHHFHPVGGAGSRCVDCHMPSKHYMQVDPRRDHSFRVPRPDLTMRIGTPNACNGCHEDESARWAVEEIAKRHPRFVAGRVAGGHYGLAFAGARKGDPASFKPLLRLAQEPTEPAIVRATAVHYLQRFQPQDAVRGIAPTLVDPDGLVRATAASAIGRLIPPNAPDGLLQQTVHVLDPLLTDPVRHVRTEAARSLAGPAERFLAPGDRAAFDRALAEWRKSQEDFADLPAPHLNLGALHEAQNEPAKAIAAYQRAIELDPNFAPARFNLATLLAGRGQLTEAESHLRAVVERYPENGEGWYSLGLLLSERKDARGSVEALARATRLMPTRGRVRYNYALALQGIGDAEQSLVELRKAHASAPQDPGILDALALMHIAREEWDEAEALTLKLKRLRPQAPGIDEALQRIREARARQDR